MEPRYRESGTEAFGRQGACIIRGHAPERSFPELHRPRPHRLALTGLVPDAGDCAFVLRCVLDEGPTHHRGANYVLLAMLGELVDALGDDDAGERESVAPVAMRVPPHLSVGAPKHDPIGEGPRLTSALPRSLEQAAVHLGG